MDPIMTIHGLEKATILCRKNAINIFLDIMKFLTISSKFISGMFITFSDLVVKRVRKIGSDPSLKLLEGRRIVDIAAVIRQARALEDHECKRVENPGFVPGPAL
jgi:hypothetical protein